jgi:hypothetical protein
MFSEHIARAFASEFLNYACGRWTGGRAPGDAVYRQITEGRDVGALRESYSSSGDLAHWLLFRMGCRSPFINRREHLGFRVGQNVSLLVGESVAESTNETDLYRAGDILVIWSMPNAADAHVMVVLSHDATTLTSAEYGQPGGAFRAHPWLRPGWVGPRAIHKVLRLMNVMQGAEANGNLLEPDYTTLPIAQAYAVQHATVSARVTPSV